MVLNFIIMGVSVHARTYPLDLSLGKFFLGSGLGNFIRTIMYFPIFKDVAKTISWLYTYMTFGMYGR